MGNLSSTSYTLEVIRGPNVGHVLFGNQSRDGTIKDLCGLNNCFTQEKSSKKTVKSDAYFNFELDGMYLDADYSINNNKFTQILNNEHIYIDINEKKKFKTKYDETYALNKIYNIKDDKTYNIKDEYEIYVTRPSQENKYTIHINKYDEDKSREVILHKFNKK
jgi:hypothetical protein